MVAHQHSDSYVWVMRAVLITAMLAALAAPVLAEEARQLGPFVCTDEVVMYPTYEERKLNIEAYGEEAVEAYLTDMYACIDKNRARIVAEKPQRPNPQWNERADEQGAE